MKIRSGFVSNSSSSSFIVISDNVDMSLFGTLKGRQLELGPGSGESEFGWQHEEYYDFPSKANFTYIQISYLNDDEYKEQLFNMLDEVICKYTGATSINWSFKTGEYGVEGAFIDHQSASYEGENTQMLESEQSMRNFLFGRDSKIVNGNDNG